MNNSKRLAVILSNYNHGKFLPESLDSLLHQSRKADEIIIIDDASSDNSVEILNAYAGRNPEIRLICNEQNRGYLHNAKMALDMIESEYFFAASADDIYLPDFFERSMPMLEANPQTGLCSGLSLVLKKEGRKPTIFPSLVVSMTASYFNPAQVGKILTKLGSWFMGNTAIYNKNIYQELGGYEVIRELSSFADGFMMQMVALRSGACFIPVPLSVWRRTGKGWSDTVTDESELSNRILARGEVLMKGRFSGFVPNAYIDLWEKDFIFSRKKNAMNIKYKNNCENESNATFVRKYFQSVKHFIEFIKLLISQGSMRVIKRYIRTGIYMLYYNIRNL